MKQKQFEAEYATLWSDVQSALQDKKAPQNLELPALYRRLCQSLTLALQRGYSPALTEFLQTLVLDCHTRLYGRVVERPLVLRYWMLELLPQRVREEWRLLLLVLAAFWGVGLAVGALIWMQPQWAYSFMSSAELNEFRAMYRPGMADIGRGGDEGDVLMFGFYIWNNISIGFRTFAAGIFGGVPALISVTFNGMHLGVVGSWLTKDPAARDVFWPFVVTHASFEVTGLLLSGLAGMRLGLALIHPGRLSRRHALLHASHRMFPVVIGAALLTLLAAFVEAFWSADPSFPAQVKYGVGALCWLSIVCFFVFAGRGRA